MFQSKSEIEKLKNICSAENIGKFVYVDLNYLKKLANFEWQSVILENLAELHPLSMNSPLSCKFFLWICRR